MAGYAGNWVMTAINLVNEGLSFTGVELLLANAPDLTQLHRDEVLDLIKPQDSVRRHIAGILRRDIRTFEQIRAELPMQQYVRINRLRNRYAVYSNDFLDAAMANPSELPAVIAAVNARHDVWNVIDLLDPITAKAWRLLMSGQMKQGELIKSMVSKEAQRRLFTIKINRLLSKAQDASIEADMKALPKELRSPFDSAPPQWDGKERVLYFTIGSEGRRVQITM